MQVDYSENYKNAEQDETQSLYFGHNCFSIFTACCYYCDGGELAKCPITITSESNDQSRIAAFSCTTRIVQQMKEKMNHPLNKVII